MCIRDSVNNGKENVGHEFHHLHLSVVHGWRGHHAHLYDERYEVDERQDIKLVTHERNAEGHSENALLHR